MDARCSEPWPSKCDRDGSVLSIFGRAMIRPFLVAFNSRDCSRWRNSDWTPDDRAVHRGQRFENFCHAPTVRHLAEGVERDQQAVPRAAGDRRADQATGSLPPEQTTNGVRGVIACSNGLFYICRAEGLSPLNAGHPKVGTPPRRA